MFDLYSLLYIRLGGFVFRRVGFVPMECHHHSASLFPASSTALAFRLSFKNSRLGKSNISRFRDESSYRLITEAAFSISSHTKCLQLFFLPILALISSAKASPYCGAFYGAFSNLPQDKTVRLFVEQEMRTAPSQADWLQFADPRPPGYAQDLMLVTKWWSHSKLGGLLSRH